MCSWGCCSAVDAVGSVGREAARFFDAIKVMSTLAYVLPISLKRIAFEPVVVATAGSPQDVRTVLSRIPPLIKLSYPCSSQCPYLRTYFGIN